MFQLIISILAIILAVALAGVSVYYGGSAFSNGSERAGYATLTNQGAQIEAAMTLHRATEGESAANIDELVSDEYLKQNPDSDWTLIDQNGNGEFDFVVNLVDAGDAECLVSEQPAVTTAAAAVTTANLTVAGVGAVATAAEVATDPVAAAMTGVSGCFNADVDADAGTTTDVNVFYYAL